MKKELKIKKSMELYNKAFKLMPSGVSSNARLWHAVCPRLAPCAIFVDRAKGSHIWDVDGNEYIDYRLGFGPIILGHAYKKIHDFVHKIDDKGLLFALDSELEIKVAQEVHKIIPCAEMVRFSNTGTEATMTALRIARAFTGKEKILKFEGHYHGHHDYLLYNLETKDFTFFEKATPSSLGIPKVIDDLVYVARFNNFESVERIVKAHADEIAAIICEPVMANAGVIPGKKEFLQFLKKTCEENNMVFIMDEVKTGFRLALGGAQSLYKIKPHLATFAKSFSNGYPISMITGKKEIMEMIAPGKVRHGGTYAGNPVSMAAAYATLQELKKPKVYKHMYWYGENLMKGITEVLSDNDIHSIIQGFPTMFQFMCSIREEITEYRDMGKCDFTLYPKIQFELLKNGVMIDEDAGEAIYLCYSHSKRDLEDTIEAFKNAVPDAKTA